MNMGGSFNISLPSMLVRANELILVWEDRLPHLVLATLSWTRKHIIFPTMKVAIATCTVMMALVMLEKMSMGFTSLYAKVFRRRPERMYRCDPIEEDEELGSLAYPMVLVQIPMYNEKEVYQLSIQAACNMTWPSDRVIIQVLDDSTDQMIKEQIDEECDRWQKKGKDIKLERRGNRKGYKAGALKSGLKYGYTQVCEYVAMFDADFQPEPDFLIRTIPFLVHNPKLALVQARWKYVNADECLMTRMQEMTMDYHFKVEQEAGSIAWGFFGFNGTAGVWRILAINEAGGWEDRTTVEDMDLAVRASLRDWKFVYNSRIKVKSELPSTFKAYRYQQHRWSCGPALLLKKMFWQILLAKKVSCLKKVYIIYNFFFVRRIVANVVTFLFYCFIIPVSIFFPEIEIPKWSVVYVPAVISLLNVVGTPSSIHLIVFWVLFENVNSLHRCKAVFIGLCEGGRAGEWVVTLKLGDMQAKLANSSIFNKSKGILWERFHPLELLMGLFLLLCACYDYKFKDDYFFPFFFLQSLAFFVMGLNYVGIIVPRDA